MSLPSISGRLQPLPAGPGHTPPPGRCFGPLSPTVAVAGSSTLSEHCTPHYPHVASAWLPPYSPHSSKHCNVAASIPSTLFKILQCGCHHTLHTLQNTGTWLPPYSPHSSEYCNVAATIPSTLFKILQCGCHHTLHTTQTLQREKKSFLTLFRADEQFRFRPHSTRNSN